MTNIHPKKINVMFTPTSAAERFEIVVVTKKFFYARKRGDTFEKIRKIIKINIFFFCL